MSDPIPPPPPVDAAPEPEALDLIHCPLYRRSDLDAVAQPLDWLWHGYVARGQITLLTGTWKGGKTTLLAALLAKLHAGGELAGLAVRPGRAVVLTEEGGSLWAERCRRFDIGGHVAFGVRPFSRPPTAAEWDLLLRNLADLHRRRPIDLLALDPLAAVLPGRDENAAANMTARLMPLRQLAARGVAVLLLHHPRKDRPAGGAMARGSGALSAAVDVLMELLWYDRPADADRRRRVQAWSRHADTPRQLVVELTAAGTDFAALGDYEEEAFRGSWQQLGPLLGGGEELTAADLLERWPSGRRPAPATLYGWLARVAAAGLLERRGTGRRGDPYRYRRPEGSARPVS